MTTMAGEWTHQDSLDLDAYAMRHFITPLRRDPVLWDLFEEDRREAPREGPKQLAPGLRGEPMPTYCKECHRPLRSRRTRKEDALPGAVAHYGHGHCDNCYSKKWGKTGGRNRTARARAKRQQQGWSR